MRFVRSEDWIVIIHLSRIGNQLVFSFLLFCLFLSKLVLRFLWDEGWNFLFQFMLRCALSYSASINWGRKFQDSPIKIAGQPISRKDIISSSVRSESASSQISSITSLDSITSLTTTSVDRL